MRFVELDELQQAFRGRQTRVLGAADAAGRLVGTDPAISLDYAISMALQGIGF